MSAETTSFTSGLRRPLLLRTMFNVLGESSEPRPAGDVLDEVARRQPLTAHELEENRSNSPRYVTFLRFASSHASRVGWLAKRGGQWSLTDAGTEAVEQITDDPELYQELSRRYRQAIRAHKKRLTRAGPVADLLGAVEAGYWTSVADLAEATGISAEDVRYVLAHEDVSSRHRVLADDGALGQHAESAAQRSRLAAEGIEFDPAGRASSEQRITADELQEALEGLSDEAPSGRRAWLVRGSSVDGRNMIPTWLGEGWVSLAATNLRALDLPVSRGQLAEFVGVDYQHKAYAVRQSKIAEFDAFLNQMKLGDLVLTTAGGNIYGGSITDVASQHTSDDGHSNLRLAVTWHNPSAPIAFPDLPEPLPAKLSSQADIVDLTEALPAIERLLHVEGHDTAPPRELVLPDADDGLAESLHFDRDWLQETIELLRDRRQLIFYGPPGTGKTYLAQRLAEHLTETQAYKLVQFHPSYSYEDFFEGYRPVKTTDGTLSFELHPGPLRRVVEVARDDPATPYILIIDEINRANLAKVFGELYFLLEYRDRSIDLLYSTEETDFTVPPNVFFIGTMNTADRSIALVDAAMRRRFAFLQLHPAEAPVRGLLDRWLAAEGLSDEPARLLEELNGRIDDPDFAIGPSYFMRPEVHREGGLSRMWRTDILPLLEEHHYGDAVNVAERYNLERIRKSVAAARPSSVESMGVDEESSGGPSDG